MFLPFCLGKSPTKAIQGVKYFAKVYFSGVLDLWLPSEKDCFKIGSLGVELLMFKVILR